jgi:hypothetical protein
VCTCWGDRRAPPERADVCLYYTTSRTTWTRAFTKDHRMWPFCIRHCDRTRTVDQHHAHGPWPWTMQMQQTSGTSTLNTLPMQISEELPRQMLGHSTSTTLQASACNSYSLAVEYPPRCVKLRVEGGRLEGALHTRGTRAVASMRGSCPIATGYGVGAERSAAPCASRAANGG